MLHWHMYGLSKIFEHRGVPDIGHSMEFTLTLSSLPIMVSELYLALRERDSRALEAGIVRLIPCFVIIFRFLDVILATIPASCLQTNGPTSFNVCESVSRHLRNNGSSTIGACMLVQ